MTKSATDTSTGLQTRMIKALGHPLRQRILVLLNEHEASPSTLAKQIGEPIGKVAYHVKILLDYDAIELVRTQPVRGAVEHFYRATIRPYIEDEHWAQLPLSVRRSLFDQTLQQIWEHAVEGAEHKGFDHPQTHVSLTALDLDEQGVLDVAKVLSEALERALAIQAEAAGRLIDLAEADREDRRTELAIMHYGSSRQSA